MNEAQRRASAEFLQRHVAQIRGEVAQVIQELRAAAVPGKDGRDGIDGKDGAPGADGKDGAPGRDGIDGKDGANGRDGLDGKDGRDGVDGKDGAPGLAGKDGAPGRDGIDGKDGAPGADGVPGRDGIDGKSITVDDVRPLFDTAFAAWQLEFERRGMDLIQRALDRIESPKDGKDGKDGRDAIDIGSFDVSLEDDFRTLRLSATAGGQRVERSVYIPTPVFQGVWQSGSKYERADIVTFGGSSFIARRDTTSKPETDDSWTLFTKRGRDGKSAKGAE